MSDASLLPCTRRTEPGFQATVRFLLRLHFQIETLPQICQLTSQTLESAACWTAESEDKRWREVKGHERSKGTPHRWIHAYRSKGCCIRTVRDLDPPGPRHLTSSRQLWSFFFLKIILSVEASKIHPCTRSHGASRLDFRSEESFRTD